MKHSPGDNNVYPWGVSIKLVAEIFWQNWIIFIWVQLASRWQVDGEDIEDGQKDGEDVIVQNFDDEQTSYETDSSSSNEKD